MDIKKAGSLNNIKPDYSKIKAKSEEDSHVKDKVEVGSNDGAVKPHKKWLFMNYIAADCNLTTYQLKNIDQQELVGSDENTHMVAYVDVGHEAHPIMGGSGARSYYITKDNQPDKINSELIEDFGNKVDMSDPKVLTAFIVDAMKKFPSDYVAIVLNDHGGGFTGAMADDSDGTFMSVPDLKKAFADAEKITGKKIDIIGFDACLMAEAEVAYELRNQADIMLASEESEMGAGWSYNEMLGKTMGQSISMLQKALETKIDVTPEEFAKIVVRTNEAHPKDIPTFSATDLKKMDNLAGAINEFSKAILSSNEDKSINRAVGRSEHYGGQTYPYSELHDLHHLAEMVENGVKDENVKKAAQGVKKALLDTVIANENDKKSYPNSRGLSIYAPVFTGSDLEYNYGDLEFAKDTQWDDAVVKFAYNYKGEGKKDVPEQWPDGSHRKSK